MSDDEHERSGAQGTPIEQSAWTGFLRTHAALLREMDAELRAQHGLSLAAFDVLSVVSGARERRLRLSDLAQRTLVTLSGISRLVTSLERAGLVQREPDPTNRRAVLVTLTREGRRQLAAARPAHHRSIRDRFFSRFSPAELGLMAEWWERFAEAGPPSEAGAPASTDPHPARAGSRLRLFRHPDFDPLHQRLWLMTSLTRKEAA